MKATTLLLGAAGVATLLTPVALYPQFAAEPAGQAAHTVADAAQAEAAGYKENAFERPAAGGPYPLTEWDEDGWTAPWSVGMDERTQVDASTPAHSGDQSLRVLYPEGKVGPEESGAQAPFALEAAPEYYVSMWIRFDEDFSWGTSEYAGKVGIGLAGGDWCSGGQTCDGTNGFSSRFIWRRADGEAALYYYHMDKQDTYGDHVSLEENGSVIHWPKGEWVNVVQRVKVNTVTGGQANHDGEIEVFYNGRSAAEVTGLRFVTNDDQVDTAYFDSFAGGATTEFAPRNDSYIWYDDIKVSTDPADICELDDGCA
ncbi:polysaccharide lyase [Nocardiopsis sediminis]|uniref:Polysaccharide lyase n=1 Tax=Nocardiopsis sediminis TaxID=1778267 RepID=A0ABV8FJ63_9ACTN